ncbi:MAG: DUF262 domain-containing protein [Bacteroidales bacterium]|nr:DUF262 domain-containing protein [Bacteroidales bacterium]
MDATITLREFIEKRKKFVIPNYQRGYIWGKSRGSEKNSVQYVLESIENCIKSGTDLFMQGITVTETDNEIILIDGQQRTTFFYLLLTYLGYKEQFEIEYPIRTESQFFLNGIKNKTSIEIEKMCDENDNEDFQDIYYFKKTIRLISKTQNLDQDKILDKVQFLYIKIPEDKATIVFSMMNGSKASMKTEEIIKAELLRLVSLDKVSTEGREAEAIRWEQNLLRSKYAREWDKWLYWWNRKEVSEFYHTGNNVMGLLVKTYLKSKGGKIDKEGKYFEEFRDKLLRGDNNEKKAKEVFYDLRHLQKKFEDVFYSINDGKKLHNKVGAILTLLGRDDRDRFVNWYFCNEVSEQKIDEYYKFVFLGLSHTSIFESKKEDIDSAKTEMLNAVSNNNLYNEQSNYAYKQLLRRNVDQDSKLGRVFDFRIWNEASLEHILPKSKFFKEEKTPNGKIRYIRGDGAEISKDEINDGMINEDVFQNKGNEHCIGNLVLLYQNENSSFGAKSFEEKKSIYFNVDAEKPFRSRHLLHTIAIFANNSWGVNEIIENKKQFINEVKEYYEIQ